MPRFGDGVTDILLAAEHLGWRVSIGTRIIVLVLLYRPVHVTNASDLCESMAPSFFRYDKQSIPTP